VAAARAADRDGQVVPVVARIVGQPARDEVVDVAVHALGFPAKAHGTPVLFKWTQNHLHTWAWDVPLEFESGATKYGSFYVDAYTGEIIMNE